MIFLVLSVLIVSLFLVDQAHTLLYSCAISTELFWYAVCLLQKMYKQIIAIDGYNQVVGDA